MTKQQLQVEIKKLEQELNNSNLTPQEKEKLNHWKGLLEQDLKNA